MKTCPQCASGRIVTGRLLGDAEAVFRPDQLRFLALTIVGGATLAKKSYACRDCGLIWNCADKVKLNRFLQKHCTDLEDNSSS